jgi:hypothetical protein
MEDRQSHRVVGACGITSKVGGFQPFWSYKIESVRFESNVINVRKDVPVLTILEEHDGPCEIGSLFLHPDYRGGGNGRMLQLVRFLLIAEHRDRFESTVVSEIRGVLDANGRSPFWNAIGQHFFGIDFAEADRLSVVNKKFIAELMPRHPIYIPLLPLDAQAVIGKPHPIRPAQHRTWRPKDSVSAGWSTFSTQGRAELPTCRDPHRAREPPREDRGDRRCGSGHDRAYDRDNARPFVLGVQGPDQPARIRGRRHYG